MSLYTYVYFCAHGIGVVAKNKKIRYNKEKSAMEKGEDRWQMQY